MPLSLYILLSLWTDRLLLVPGPPVALEHILRNDIYMLEYVWCPLGCARIHTVGSAFCIECKPLGPKFSPMNSKQHGGQSLPLEKCCIALQFYFLPCHRRPYLPVSDCKLCLLCLHQVIILVIYKFFHKMVNLTCSMLIIVLETQFLIYTLPKNC